MNRLIDEKLLYEAYIDNCKDIREYRRKTKSKRKIKKFENKCNACICTYVSLFFMGYDPEKERISTLEFKNKYYRLVKELRKDISMYVDEMECASLYVGAFDRITLLVEKFLEDK